MENLKVVFVGCGGIANWHLERLIKMEDISLVGFYDIIPERADKMVEVSKQGKRCNSLTELYDTKPDAVFICVPPAEHGEIEFEAIKRGIHIMIQKPMTLSNKLTEEIGDAIKKSGIVSCVSFQDRYLDLADKMQEYLKNMKVGLVTGAWVGGIPGVPWWRKMSTSGGQVVEQNIHLFDMLRYFLGEPETVYATAKQGYVKVDSSIEGYDVHDYSVCTITFKSGEIATILTGDYFAEGGTIENGLSFYGNDSALHYVLRDKLTLKTNKSSTMIKTKNDNGYEMERAFFHAIRTGDCSKIRSSYEDAAKSLKFTLACNESIETGKPVNIGL